MRQREEIEVDSFAGGGGASLGLSWALGHAPAVAINHDAAAIAMHAANHPETEHFTEDVWKLSPRTVTRGRPVGLLWASPDCKHFSRAKGGKPVEKRIRSLAWVVARWAVECQPRVIILENVREFEDWGPLVPRWECQECTWRGAEAQARQIIGRRDNRWHSCPRCGNRPLRETIEQVPDPSRKGLTFRRFVGRLKNLGYACDWKVLNAADYGAPTHRRRLFLIARNDGMPIRWPEPTHGAPGAAPELFATRKPWRTAAECIDWTIPFPSIFTRKRPLAEATLRRIAMGVKRYVLDDPKPFLVVCNHGGGEFRGHGLDEPLATVTASRDAHGIVTPYLMRYNTPKDASDHKTHGLNEPCRTVVAENRFAVIAPYMIPRYGEREDQQPRCLRVNEPAPVITPAANSGTLVAANLIHLNHGEKAWNGIEEPLRTVTTGNHAALVYSFLAQYNGGSVGAALHDPLPTATTKDRFGLVTVTIEGEPYVIVDIGMRMLQPRELARAQGFPDSYVLTGSNTSQVGKIGNSVCPVMAKVLVEANYP